MELKTFGTAWFEVCIINIRPEPQESYRQLRSDIAKTCCEDMLTYNLLLSLHKQDI